MVKLKLVSLTLSVLLRITLGGDPWGDPYDAAIVAAYATNLNERVVGRGMREKHGAAWLVATGITGSRLQDLREKERRLYNGTAIHKIDAKWGKSKYTRAVYRGDLDPVNCYWHRDVGDTNVRGERPYARWSTRGPYEMGVEDKYKYAEEWIGTNCFPPAWFDVPLINAVIAAEYAKDMCDRYGRHGRRRPCDWRFLRCLWAGIGLCQDDEFRHGMHKRFSRRIRQARRIMRQRGDL